MRTFDGVKYDCQGEGEFEIVKSLDSDFSLQGRFVKSDPKKRPTITEALVFNTGDDGVPKIQVNVPESSKNGCTPYIFIEGMDVDCAMKSRGTV